MTGLPKDLLSKLQNAIDAKTGSPTEMASLLGKINKSLDQANARDERKAKREAKQAELREGGRRAHEQDWVTGKAEYPKPDVVIQPIRQQAPITPPKPVAERSTEELYQLLAERWRRYVKVITDRLPDQKVALANATKVAELLQERGESMEQIVAFIEATTQD